MSIPVLWQIHPVLLRILPIPRKSPRKRNRYRPMELKNILKGNANYVILSATIVRRRRKFFTSKRLKRLEKLYICWREVM